MEYIILARPKHYIKNLLIFLPLVFSGNFFNLNMLLKSIIAFLSFSLAASYIYIINDIKDIDKDRLHKMKKNRPLASGKISIKNAIMFAIILLILSYVLEVIGTNTLFHKSYIFILIYVVLNLGYSFGLKNVPLLDVAILTSGFLIRLMYGASVFSIDVSNWLYLTVLSAAFYLGLGKRRNEIKEAGSKSRNVLKYYSKDFLDKNMYMFLTLAIVFYSLWAVDPINVLKSGNLLVWTVPFVILILLRYGMDIEKDNYGDPVEVVIGDKILLGSIFIYIALIIGIIYIG